MPFPLSSNPHHSAQVGGAASAAVAADPKNDRTSEAPPITGTPVPVEGALGAGRAQELLAARASQQAIQSLFLAGGQLPVALPPPGLPNDPAIRTLGSKCQALLAADADGMPAGSAGLGGSDAEAAGSAAPGETAPAAGSAGALGSFSGRTLGDADNGSVGGNDGPRRPVPPSIQFSMTVLLNEFLRVIMDQFKSSMVAAQQDLQLKVTDLDAAAQEVEAAAKKRFTGAAAMAAGTMALGATGMIAAGVNLKGTFKANAELTSSGIPTGQQGMEFQRLTAEASAYASGVQSSGSLLQGGMQVLQGQEDCEAAKEDSNKALDEKASVTDEALYTNEQNMRQQMSSTLQDALEKTKSWEQSQDQAASAINHNI